jgi:lysophospholipase L1-like esterase
VEERNYETGDNYMFNRRAFLKTSAVGAGVAAFSAQVSAEKPNSNPAGAVGYNYRLPQFKKGSRLLFQGDSITDMKWGRNQSDRNHYLGHSYVYLIAARLGVDMPEAALDIYNRGMSGHKVGDLRKRWQKDALDMKPDLLSILIGVNDVGRNLGGVDLETLESDYRFLLDSSRKVNPALRLVLLDPFVLASGRLSNGDAFKKWRDQVERIMVVVKQLATDYKAVHVKTQAVFDDAAKKVSPEQWIWDGVHPLPQGHELIARTWLDGVSARWG